MKLLKGHHEWGPPLLASPELERDLHPFIQQRPTKTLSPLLMTPALSSPRLTPKKGDLSISYSSGLVVRRNVLSV